VVEVATGGLEEVVDGDFVHVLDGFVPEGDALGSGDEGGAVKGLEDDDLDVLDPNGVTGVYHLAARGGNAPPRPDVDAPLRPDEGHRLVAVLEDGGGDVDIDVITVDVGGHDGVDLADREGIEDKGHVAQVGLELLDAAHALHLVLFLHHLFALGALARTRPEVDRDVGTAGGT
jgi:hypothetical protein